MKKTISWEAVAKVLLFVLIDGILCVVDPKSAMLPIFASLGTAIVMVILIGPFIYCYRRLEPYSILKNLGRLLFTLVIVLILMSGWVLSFVKILRHVVG